MRSLPVVVDQAISAASNFILISLLARNSSVAEFGSYMIVYAIYLFFIQVYQAVVAESMLVLGVKNTGQVRGALAIAVVFGVVAGVAMSITLVVQGAPGYLAGLTLLAGPGLLLHESCRHVLIATRRAWGAVMIDSAWLAALLLTVAGGLAKTAPAAFMNWQITGVAAAIVGLVLALRPAQDVTVSAVNFAADVAQWRTSYAAHAKGYGVENITLAACSQGLVLGIAAVASIEETGGFRAIQAVFGPLSMVLLALRFAGLAKWGATEQSPDTLRGVAARLSSLLVVGAIGYGVMVAFVPASVGVFFFGDSWASVENLGVTMAVLKTLVAVTTALLVAVRLLNQVRRTAQIRVFIGLSQLTLGLLGAAVWGASGTIWGLIVAEVLCVTLLGSQLLRAKDSSSPDLPVSAEDTA